MASWASEAKSGKNGCVSGVDSGYHLNTPMTTKAPAILKSVISTIVTHDLEIQKYIALSASIMPDLSLCIGSTNLNIYIFS